MKDSKKTNKPVLVKPQVRLPTLNQSTTQTPKGKLLGPSEALKMTIKCPCEFILPGEIYFTRVMTRALEALANTSLN